MQTIRRFFGPLRLVIPYIILMSVVLVALIFQCRYCGLPGQAPVSGPKSLGATRISSVEGILAVEDDKFLVRIITNVQTIELGRATTSLHVSYVKLTQRQLNDLLRRYRVTAKPLETTP